MTSSFGFAQDDKFLWEGEQQQVSPLRFASVEMTSFQRYVS
jgi:hypothetical protein